jgi:hypothetical protein
VFRAFFSALLYGGVLLAALYAVTALPFGQFTLFEHAARILETPEGRDLREGVKETGDTVEQRVRRELDTIARRPTE